MVANIRSGSSPGGALYYNKEKMCIRDRALRDAAHVHSGEADEDAQKPRDEQHEVLRRES